VKVGHGAPGPITKKLQDAFFGILNGSMPDEYHWLTFVK
jgi:branched-chain amino acid aminotransferase